MLDCANAAGLKKSAQASASRTIEVIAACGLNFGSALLLLIDNFGVLIHLAGSCRPSFG
jgi:hypothetical protein